MKVLASEIPPDLLHCTEAVEVPPSPYTDATRGRFVADLGAAWEDCGGKVAAIRRFVLERPPPPE
jgi:hypothetical protein